MNCQLCGINKNDKEALDIITRTSGCWTVRIHKGHIVKIARNDRELTIEEARKRYKIENVDE